MKKSRTIWCLWLVCVVIISSLSPFILIKPLSADPGKLMWDIVNTPSDEGKVVVSPSEINALAIGSDGVTFYAIDIPGDGTYPNGKIYKSTNAGITWQDEMTRNLDDADATLPAWDIAIAPDDPDFIAVVTDSRQKVYISTNGGDTWSDTNVPALGAGFAIADIVISPLYTDTGSYRDIAIGTRKLDAASNGKVYIRQYPTFIGWYERDLVEDITSLCFSPSYDIDRTLLVVTSDTTNTYLHFGRELATTTPDWDWLSPSFPITLDTTVAQDDIIWSDIELPSDYNSGNHGTVTPPKIYISYDFDGVNRQGKVCRIDDTTRYFITPPGMGSNGVSSIAYYGSIDSGRLFAAEAKTDSSLAKVNIWRTFNPTVTSPTWDCPSNFKQPTGGAGSGYANAQIAWSPDGGTVYCGTGTATVNTAADWAVAANWDTGLDWDESAFSVSLDDAKVWNQISLIDTGLIDPTPPPDNLLLTDVAITTDSKTMYLASVNQNDDYFDSIWRTTSDPLAQTWERILCFKTAPDDPDPNPDDYEIILRLDPRVEDTELIFFAVPGTDTVWYSQDQGQNWYDAQPNAPVTDLTLASETTVYLLDDIWVHRGTAKAGVGAWIWQEKVGTCLSSGHTITTPLKNPTDEEWVIVGDAEQGRVAYANFLAKHIEFERIEAVPVPGKIHVLCDDKFHENITIYTASDATGGKIYRWVLKLSTAWQELEPLNEAFYGLTQQAGVFYGAWWDISTDNTGVDRTLYPTAPVPPPLEWDDLTVGLPESGDPNYPVCFNHEPISLKSSRNTDIYLWAIDNNDYDFAAEQGCLWTYTDLLAVAGPWTLSPAPGELIGVDPPTGRSVEVNFRWQQFPETRKYEFWLAKDEEFTLTLIKELHVPFDLEGPAYILPPGVLEVGHTYYWEVRAREAVTGEEIRSPWSATMFFTVKSGLRVTTPYIGPMPLTPANDATSVPIKPVSFSWTSFKDTTKYHFQLASDSSMTKILVDTETPTTAYSYDKELEPDTNYFWRVRATKLIPSDWSPIFCFRTETAPIPAPPTEPSRPAAPPPTRAWVWFLISVVTLLCLAVLVLVTTKPRYVKPQQDKVMMSDALIRSKNPIARLIDSIRARLRRRRYFKNSQ